LIVFSSQFPLPALPDCNSSSSVAPMLQQIFTPVLLSRSIGWAREAALYIEVGAHMAHNAIDLLFRRGSKKR